MPRQTLDFTVIKTKGTPYYRGKIGSWKNYRSTGETTRARAEKVTRGWFEESLTEKSVTFGEYAGLFYTDNCPHCTRLKGEDRPISQGHIAARRGIIENYVLGDPISQVDISALKRNDFLNFRDRIHVLGLSNAMKNKITGTAKTILREALFREMINRDITAGVGNLRESDKRTKYVPTLEEVRSVILPGEHHDSEMARIAFVLLASTGMRRSELIALRWDRIREDTIVIDRAYKAPGKPGIEDSYGPPKWGIVRQIPLPPIVAETLSRWPRLGDYIISHVDGKPYGPRWVNINWNQVIKNLGIDRTGLVPHSLRYFVNSWFLNQGFPAQHVRSYLGWSEESDSPQSRITRVQKGYLQVSVEELQPLATALSDALG